MPALMDLLERGRGASGERAERHLDGGRGAFRDAEIDDAVARQHIDMRVGRAAARDKLRIECRRRRIAATIKPSRGVGARATSMIKALTSCETREARHRSSNDAEPPPQVRAPASPRCGRHLQYIRFNIFM